MTNLSPETCIRLKDAGFPQPERAPGQLWYCRGDLCVLYRVIPDGILAASLQWPAHYGATNSEDWVYCPTALELLALLPEWDLSAFHDCTPFDWQLYSASIFKDNVHNETVESISERLAEIWLSENENPQ